jgi:hypothetical protein
MLLSYMTLNKEQIILLCALMGLITLHMKYMVVFLYGQLTVYAWILIFLRL